MGDIENKYIFENNSSMSNEPITDITPEIINNKKRDLRERVLSQIKSQGFIITEDGGIKKPNMESKDYLRTFHESACKSRYLSNKKFLDKNERKLIDFFADGNDINIDSIEVGLQVVESETIESDLFRFASLYWSVPVSNGFGRRVRFLLWDKSNHKLIGIFALGDPVFNLRCRDEWIGWNSKMRERRLYNVMDIFVLGAVPPYNMLLGGKLVALAAASNEVRSVIKKRYANNKTIIEGRKKNSTLVLLTTGSALGKSSLYDRIKFNNNLIYQRIGSSIGWGHFHLNHGLFEDMREYLELIDPKKASANRFGEGPNWKIRTAKLCLKELDLSENLLKHGINREIYGVPLSYNFKEFLKGETYKHDDIDMPFKKLSEYWKNRWLYSRAETKPEYKIVKKEDLQKCIHKYS